MAAPAPPPAKSIPASLNPRTITLSTFRTLLAHYEETVHRVTRKKALAKQGGKKATPKQKKKAAPKRKVSSEEGEEDDDDSKLENANGDEDGDEDDEPNPQADAAAREFWKLDTWRYETLPRILSERSQLQLQEGEENGKGNGKGKGKVEGVHLTKDEVIKLMEWKLKHGIYRPTLMGMLKSNPERAIQSATAAAFASLPSSPNSPDSPNSNDQPLSATLTSLNALTAPLRGIGPATASLLLSAASPAQIPFYSDDTFLWLIVGMYPKWSDEDGWVRGEVKSAEKRKMVKPSGELIAKYHVAEYKALFEAVRGLVSRLNGEREALGDGAKGEEVGCAELERVAFVVRHVRESGLAGIKGEDEDEDVKQGEDDKVGSKDEGASRKKRKVRK